MKQTIHIFALSIEPSGISGSETILVETYKRFNSKHFKIILHTWEPGMILYKSLGLNNIDYHLSHIPVVRNFYISFLIRVLAGIHTGLSLKIAKNDRFSTILYPGSDFWPDFLAAVLIKIRYPNSKLIGTYYLSAPNPLIGYKEKFLKLKIPTINNIFYWLMQIPIVPAYNKFARIVFLTSTPDKVKFKEKQTYIVRGGVDIDKIDAYKRAHTLSDSKKIYDCVFMGRFHPQKGIIEMINVWSFVVKAIPTAKMILIGDGPLKKQAEILVSQLNLEHNIIFTGYIIDPDKKFDIFSASKIVTHPAIYDSGGMAAAEAMAFGLPGIAFDLVALRSYYPQGVIKIPPYDYKLFAESICLLLTDEILYSRYSKEAIDLIYNTWNWDRKSSEIEDIIKSL